MAPRVVLHVGLMKSGTTFLQGRLDANRERLAGQDVLFPGPSWGRHSRAVSDLLGSTPGTEGAWDDLCAEINAHRGTAVVSMEYLGPLGPARVQRAASSFPGAVVQVVATVRDLGRSVPAMWQEGIKNRRTWDWPAYVDALRSEETDAGRRFWRQQHSARILRRWGAVVGVDQLRLVTVPPPGAPPETLWERFGSVVGLAPDDWRAGPRSNESLGAASTLVMQRVNRQTADLTAEQYKRRVKALAKHLLSQRRGDEEPIGFTVPSWLRKRAIKLRGELESSGVTVVGSLDELEPLDVLGIDPSRVEPSAQLDAAVSGLALTLHQVGRIRRP